jgi:anti-sigma-K factor RskA
MNCDEVEDLIGAYVLGALPFESLADIGEHLATCGNHPEAPELQSVASSLALAAPEMEPPPALKTRLMDAVRAEAGPAEARSRGQGLLGGLRRLVARPAFPYALAGSLAVAVVALVIANIGGSTEPDTATVTLSGAGEENAVVHLLEEDIVVIEVDGLEPVAADQTYQVWVITDGTPASLGLFNTTSQGEALTSTRADLSGADAIAVTVEPAGGSIAPTTQPFLVSEDAIPR